MYTDGKYIKNELGQKVFLRGCAFIEPAYYVDRLNGPGTLASRAERLKELGVNFIRLEINIDNWNANTDTNGDGIGNRDFTIQAIQELTSRGIYVMPGLMGGSFRSQFPYDTQAWINWLLNNIVIPFKDNPGVCGVYIFNEPAYSAWGGTNYSGYWNAVKQVCQAIYEANPNLLVIVHANTQEGFYPPFVTDPIPTPNVVYTWHYYYSYGPAFNPYLGWMSGVLDPNYQDLVNRGQPFYQSYYLGNYAKARQEFEQWLYNGYLWVSEELNLPVINDEYGWTGDEEPYFSFRACKKCLAANNGVVQRDVTFWNVAQTLDAPGGNGVGEGPYPDVTYCPRCGEPLPRPHEHLEPGWPQCMKDFHAILNKYETHWTYYAWWPKTYGGYGLTIEGDMSNLSEPGKVWAPYLTPLAPIPPTAPTKSGLAILAVVVAGLFLLLISKK